MNFLSSFWNWIKKAKISSWNTTQGEFDKEMRNGRVGSYDESKPDDTKIRGIKVTLPLPEEK